VNSGLQVLQVFFPTCSIGKKGWRNVIKRLQKGPELF